MLLRPLTMDDASFMVQMWDDPAVNRFIGGPKSPDQTREKIRTAVKHQQQHGFARWAVTRGGELIGLCGPMLREIGGVTEVELGYAFPRAHWGQGYATEAAGAALQHCTQVLGHKRVVAIIHPDNHASIRVIEKIGMRFERSIAWEGGPVNLYVR